MSRDVKEVHYTDLVLPSVVATKIDIAHLVNDMEQIDSEMTAHTVREGIGETDHAAPVLSDRLSAFLSDNNLSIDDSRERSLLIEQLKKLKNHVPVIHMTFATEADRESLGQVVSWLRGEVHAQAVITVGLQPALVAGVYMRTSNQVYDMSLRGALSESRGLLLEKMEALRGNS